MQLLVLFVHLLATCTALGAIIACDLRLLSKLDEYPTRIAPPNAFVVRLVAGSLLVLYASGALLVWIGLGENPAYLNPKLQGKLLLVGLLTANAVVLHWLTFPRLSRRRPLLPLCLHDALVVAAPVALSHCLWLYCAFLGIARPWNEGVSVAAVLGLAALLFALAFAAVLGLLTVACRSRPRGRPDWVDSVKGRLGALGQAWGV